MALKLVVDQVQQEQIINELTKQTIDRINKLPDSLEPDHVREILNMGRRQIYEFLDNPPFPVRRIGRLYKIPKFTFFNWFYGDDQKQG